MAKTKSREKDRHDLSELEEYNCPMRHHNGGPTDGASGVAADRLRSFFERIERLEEDRAAVGQDIKEVYAEAKGEGFDPKIMRMVIRIRKMDKAERQEQDALLDLYLSALGEI